MVTHPPLEVEMRVRILKLGIISNGALNPGDVMEVDEVTGRKWCQAGIAMQDKSLDGARETKVKVTERKGKRGRRR